MWREPRTDQGRRVAPLTSHPNEASGDAMPEESNARMYQRSPLWREPIEASGDALLEEINARMYQGSPLRRAPGVERRKGHEPLQKAAYATIAGLVKTEDMIDTGTRWSLLVFLVSMRRLIQRWFRIVPHTVLPNTCST